MRDVTGIPDALLDVIARAIKLHIRTYCMSLVARIDALERTSLHQSAKHYTEAIENLRSWYEADSRQFADNRRDLERTTQDTERLCISIVARLDAIEKSSQREPVVNVTSFPVKDHTEAVDGLRRGQETQAQAIADDRRELDRLRSSIEAVVQQVKTIEAREPTQPKDGEPGRDAFELDVLPVIDFARDYPRGTLAQHQGGIWRAHANTHGEHGWSCVVDGIASTFVEMTSERSFTVHIQRSGGAHETATFAMPVMIYRGVFVAGETYKTGDAVTWAGSLWHCNATTDTKPDAGGDAWTLAAKRGRDGKDARMSIVGAAA